MKRLTLRRSLVAPPKPLDYDNTPAASALRTRLRQPDAAPLIVMAFARLPVGAHFWLTPDATGQSSIKRGSNRYSYTNSLAASWTIPEGETVFITGLVLQQIRANESWAQTAPAEPSPPVGQRIVIDGTDQNGWLALQFSRLPNGDMFRLQQYGSAQCEKLSDERYQGWTDDAGRMYEQEIAENTWVWVPTPRWHELLGNDLRGVPHTTARRTARFGDLVEGEHFYRGPESADRRPYRRCWRGYCEAGGGIERDDLPHSQIIYVGEAVFAAIMVRGDERNIASRRRSRLV